MFDKIKVERLCNELDAKAMTLVSESREVNTPETIRGMFLMRATVLLDVSDVIKKLLAAE